MSINRIEEKFNLLKARGEKALIVFITAGDPNLSLTETLVLEMEKRGVDIIELGIPFSDPLADGPTIQASSQRSLKKGTTLPKIINLVKKIRKKSHIPLALMGYYNPIYVYGVKRFVREASQAGVDGIIIPDLPPEEAAELIRESRRYGLANIFLLAPTSTKDRIKRVIHDGSGFIYYVSITGVTGVREKLPQGLHKKLDEIKSLTTRPVAVGFGVSKPSQIKAILKKAEGVIIGSSLIRIIEKYSGSKGLVKKFDKAIDKFVSVVRNLPK